MMNATWLMIVGLTFGAEAATAPTPALALAQCTDAPKGDSTMIVTGEGFDASTEFYIWTPDRVHPRFQLPKEEFLKSLGQPLPPLPPEPPRQYQVRLRVLAWDPQVAALEVPRMPHQILGVHNWFHDSFTGVLYARNARGWSNPLVFHRPVLYFLDRQTASPGDQVRLVGRNFTSHFHGGQGFVVLRHVPSGRVIEPLRISRYAHGSEGGLDDHQRIFELPADLPLGDWQVYLHNTTGREYGWSEPLTLKVVERPRAVPEHTVDVKALGARGDGTTDDTAVLQQALDRAGALSAQGASRGVVFLPAGRYALSRTLRLPNGITVRGQGKANSILVAGGPVPFSGEPEPIDGLAESFNNPPGTHYFTVLWGRTDFRLEHLAVEGLGEETGVLLAVQNGREPSRHVTLEHCRFFSEGKQNARGQEWIWEKGGRKYARWFKGVAGGVQYDLRLAHCDFEGNASTWFWNLHRSYIGFNTSRTWQWHSGGAGINPRATLRHTIFEFNDKTGPRGFIMHGWDEAHHYQNLIYANKAHDTQTWDGEGLLIEGAGKTYVARVADATADTLTLDGGTFADDQLRDKVVVVTRGRGLGQYRLVAGNRGRTIALRQPWALVPARGALVTVTGGTVENVIANNYVYLSYGGGPLLYHGAALNNHIVGNRVFQSAWCYLWSSRRPGYDVNDPKASGIVPDYWNVYENNSLYEQVKFFFTFDMGSMPAVGRLEAVLQLGNVFRRGQVLRPYDLRGGDIEAPGAINYAVSPYCRRHLKEPLTGQDKWEAAHWFNVVESNRLFQSKIGVYVSERSYHAIVRNNACEAVERPLEDKGIKTCFLEDSH